MAHKCSRLLDSLARGHALDEGRPVAPYRWHALYLAMPMADRDNVPIIGVMSHVPRTHRVRRHELCTHKLVEKVGLGKMHTFVIRVCQQYVGELLDDRTAHMSWGPSHACTRSVERGLFVNRGVMRGVVWRKVFIATSYDAGRTGRACVYLRQPAHQTRVATERA